MRYKIMALLMSLFAALGLIGAPAASAGYGERITMSNTCYSTLDLLLSGPQGQLFVLPRCTVISGYNLRWQPQAFAVGPGMCDLHRARYIQNGDGPVIYTTTWQGVCGGANGVWVSTDYNGYETGMPYFEIDVILDRQH